MSIAVEGVYKGGRVELLEVPQDVDDNTRVIVTFVTASAGDIDLAEQGIDEQEAARLRIQFATFADDWDDPALDVYNDYDAAKQRD